MISSFGKMKRPFTKPQENTTRITFNGKTIFTVSSENYSIVKKLHKENTDNNKDPIIKNQVNEDRNTSTKASANIKLNYNKLNEHAGFKIGNSSKMLACLALSETVPVSLINFDPYEAKAYFNRYFRGSYKEVFDRYCAFYNYDPEQVLSHYFHILKTANIKNKLITL